ncbi:MAG: glycosyltransferase family 1 protein [Acidimicrobiia bacterium]|nr:glycosyltransferase family 1 protein [Acidimicrobiia bacterium]
MTVRVAIVAESFLPHVNGVTNSVLRTIEYLKKHDHEVTVIAPGPGETSVNETPVIRMGSFGFPGYDELRIALPKKALEYELNNIKPDVVHVAAPAVLGAWALRAARKLDVPTVAIYQTDLAGFARQYRLGATSPAVWKYIAAIHNKSDLTLAPSTSAVWDLRQHGVEKVTRWMRGVDNIKFNPSHRNNFLRHRFGAPEKIIVGFVGRLAREKQVERLAEVAMMKSVSVVVVGDGPCREKLERLMPDAHFTGFATGNELSQLYASFDVFAHTGVDETFCQSVQEALASGVPVIAPAVGGPLDLVQHGHNGFLWSPQRNDTLYESVNEIVTNHAIRETCAKNARSTVAHRTWDSVMAELVEHYRSVMTADKKRIAAEVAS